MYRIELIDDKFEGEEEAIDEEDPRKEEDSGGDEVSPIISLNAMAGIRTLEDYNTIRVSGSIKSQKVHILIDLSSTHNFIDTCIAEQLGCDLSKSPPVKVVVANGDKILCDKICARLR